MSAQNYTLNVLKPFTIACHQQPDNPVFQPNNFKPHTTEASPRFLRDSKVTVLLWTGRSPDNSPIDLVWDMISTKLRQLLGLIADVRRLRYEVFKLLGTQLYKKTLITLFETCLGELRSVLTQLSRVSIH